jgi:alkylated DNA repair dioxygenase AlkB
MTTLADASLDLDLATTSAGDARARCQKLARELSRHLGQGKYREFREAARAFQRRETTADAFATTLIQALGRSGVGGALAREAVRTTPSSAERAKLRAALGTALDDDGRASNAKASSSRANKVKVECLAPGLVCLRKFLSVEQQEWFSRACFDLGETDGDSASKGQGFFEKDADDGTCRLNQGSRGRMILHADDFDDEGKLKALCAEAVSTSRAADDAMPEFDATTVLVNFYKDGAEFKWHKDSEDPELVASRTGPPIVSFSVGLSADFGYKYSFEDPNHKVVRLNSGDVLLFGGPSRMIVHSVLNVYPGTMPGHLRGKMLNGRLNVTVRDIGRGVIDTSQFPAYRVSYGGTVAEGNV